MAELMKTVRLMPPRKISHGRGIGHRRSKVPVQRHEAGQRDRVGALGTSVPHVGFERRPAERVEDFELPARICDRVLVAAEVERLGVRERFAAPQPIDPTRELIAEARQLRRRVPQRGRREAVG